LRGPAVRDHANLGSAPESLLEGGRAEMPETRMPAKR
jgi:hypothetical protein